MWSPIILFLLTLPVLMIADLLWVGFIADSFYTKHVGHLRGPIKWQGAALFYLIYTIGILLFVTYPYTESLQKTVLLGALFGFVVYSVYNFTNHAVLNGWPLSMSIVDIAWGTLMTVGVAVVSHWILKLLA